MSPVSTGVPHFLAFNRKKDLSCRSFAVYDSLRTPPMNKTPRPTSGDPREAAVVEVFTRLCEWALRDTGDQARLEQRLWRLPEVAARFVFGAATEQQLREIDPLVHRLKGETGKLINQRLDRSSAKRALADRIRASGTDFIFRPWRPEDATCLSSLLGNPRVWEGLPDEYPGAVTEDLAGTLISIANEWAGRHLVRAVERRGEVIGQVRLQFDSSPYPDTAEISYWLGESQWGRGFGTAIVTLFTAESFERHPHLDRIFATVLQGNDASLRLLEKCGYRLDSLRHRAISKNSSKYDAHGLVVCRADYVLTNAHEPVQQRQGDGVLILSGGPGLSGTTSAMPRVTNGTATPVPTRPARRPALRDPR